MNGVTRAVFSSLLALCSALMFSMGWPRATLGAQLATSIAVAGLPLLAAWALGSNPAGASDAALSSRPRVLRGGRAGWCVGPLLALALAPAVYFWHHPRLRVLNLTGEVRGLSVDGVPTATLPPTTNESPSAGLELRLPRGRRSLALTDASGRVIASVQAELESRRDHLYAPASVGHCFWLEQTGYGRASGGSVVPLRSASQFWRIEAAVDTWFMPSPEPPPSDRRSSGGTLTSLRFARCADAPLPARAAVSAVWP
jgi:hypothetical protein